MSRPKRQLFHPVLNTLSRVSIFGGLFFVVFMSWAWSRLLRSSIVTNVGTAKEQPVPFSHKHHVGDVGLDCRYCHTGVEESRFAGLPSSKTCMTCHSQIWKRAPMLAKVRDSYAKDKSIAWTRVYDLPDFVYFDHAPHIRASIRCQRCHGPVERMPLTWKATALHMDWCTGCHRDPVAGTGIAQLARVDTKRLTSCSTCHR